MIEYMHVTTEFNQGCTAKNRISELKKGERACFRNNDNCNGDQFLECHLK